MNYADEPYVRVFKRDTANWLALSFIAQGLFLQLLRKVDRTGLLSLGKLGRRAVAVVIGHAGDWSRIEPGLDELLEDGCVQIKGDLLVIPNFLEAQEAVMSGKLRTHEWRERKKSEALSGDETSTKRDETSASGDATSRNVTRGDAARRAVTPCDPSFLPYEPSEERQASPESSAAPPLKAKRARTTDGTDKGTVEPLRLALVALIRARGVEYLDTSQAAERTNLKRALAAGATGEGILSAFRAVYGRGGWHPRIQDVARVLTSASERPAGRNGAAGRVLPVPELTGIDQDGNPTYREGGR